MLYIVTALKPEAQAFIDKYKLKKESLQNYKIFTNENIRLIVSGLGVKNSMIATQTLINHFDITDNDIHLNIGICGASDKYEIGELLNISTIKYKETSYLLKENILKTITCLDDEAHTDDYDAVIHSPAIKNRYILKVVSDHFEPHKVTKDKTKSLIFNVIDDINLLLFNQD